ncbi:MAG: DUF5011 domain-containing protein [Bacteroidia bacterium]|nr:DUF5011 domain-containing protein [Bacteroidia bacterium]
MYAPTSSASEMTTPLYGSGEAVCATCPTPKLTLTGNTPVYLEVAVHPYVESGWKASDSLDGNMSTSVRVQGKVNHMRPGVYTLTYIVTSSCGNSDTARRTVIVGDYTPPRISARYQDTVTIEKGDVYDVREHIAILDAWTDSTFLFDSLKIVSNDVNTSQPGIYSTTVVTKDSYENVSNTYVLTVVVEDNSNSSVKTLSANLPHVEVFPNPTSGIVSIRSDFPIRTTSVFNSLGKEVYRSTTNSSRTHLAVKNLDHLSDGLYFLKVELVNGTTQTQQIRVLK